MSHLIVQPPGSSASDQLTVDQLKAAIESKNDSTRLEAIQTVLHNVLNGEPMPQLLMSMIRFVMPNKNKGMKKLLYYYYEAAPKHNADGTLKQEFILACNAIRNDLQHPNEYICGNTLRFVCKIREPELLEPLIRVVRQCVDHKHPYVRKNALIAVQSIFQSNQTMMQDAPKILQASLNNETDSACKRNAFVALSSVDSHLTSNWIIQNLAHIPSMDDSIQISVLAFLKKEPQAIFHHREAFVQLFIELLDIANPVVAYEATILIIGSSKNSQDIEAATVCLLNLIQKVSDNSAKLSMLDRVSHLEKSHPGFLGEYVVNLLRILSSTDMDVRNRVLEIAQTVLTSQNVTNVVSTLKKEIIKSFESDQDDVEEYRRALVGTANQCAIAFPEVVGQTVINILLDHISEIDIASSTEIAAFIKEIAVKLPQRQADVLVRARRVLIESKSPALIQATLWLLGEFSLTEQDFLETWTALRQSIGELPILQSEELHADAGGNSLETESNKSKHTPRVLADGTYASESAISEKGNTTNGAELHNTKPPLRAFILEGNYFLCTTLAATLIKLIISYSQLEKSKSVLHLNSIKSEAMLILTSIIRVGQSHLAKQKIDYDTLSLLHSYIKLLGSENMTELGNVFLNDTKDAYMKTLQLTEAQRQKTDFAKNLKNFSQVDDEIQLRQMKSSEDAIKFVEDDENLLGISDEDAVLTNAKLSSIYQLTGFSDPVYAEAFVTHNQFLIHLDVLLVNQTDDTLQNLTLEFSTLGDLKVLEKPLVQNVAPHEFVKLRVTVKVSSTDTGVIFGNVTFNYLNLKSDTIILNDLRVNVIDYIKPANCSKARFTKMWQAFEWENKVNIGTKTNNKDGLVKIDAEKLTLKQYLDKIIKKTNMLCLTPEAALSGECDILSANLYAESLFGESALVNISLEKMDQGEITGHARIRSEGQGIALSLGEILECGV